MMLIFKRALRLFAVATLIVSAVSASASDEYVTAVERFRGAGAGDMVDSAYGYAVFPTIGKGGIGIGGAHGTGRVFEQGDMVGEVSMTQITIGLQLGGQAFSQLVLFQDKRAFDEFTSGNFEFGAQAAAVALTASASAGASTSGSGTSVAGGQNDANIGSAGYHKGMAIFTIAKGGLMYEASVGGQKFDYTPFKK